MSCYPNTLPSPPDPNAPIFQANDIHDVNYTGHWSSKADSQQHVFQVSVKKEDKATFIFTGISVRVFGRINSQGTNALFGLDQEGEEHGGISCNGNLLPRDADAEQVVLYDSNVLGMAKHTLFITNNDSPLSLSLFEVSGGSGIATPTSHASDPSFTSTTSQTTPPTNITPSSPTSSLSLPSSTSFSTATSLSSPLLSPPPSTSPIILPGNYPTDLPITGSGSVATTQRYAGGSVSYTVSSYAEVSMVSGSATTIVIQTTVEISQTQPYRGPSRGAVAGAAIGGLLFLFLLVGLGLWWWRRRRNRVRFLYGISNLDFDPAMMMRSDAELPTPRLEAAMRDSDGTLYDGDTLPPYKWPGSYLSFASDLKKHPPSERAVSAVAGDRRPSTDDERNTGSLPEERSLRDSFSGPGRQSVGSAVPPSEEHHETL